MAARRPARARSRGGVGIQALRKADARLAAGVAAVAVAGALTLTVALAGERPLQLVAGLGGAGAVLLGTGVPLRRGQLVTGAIALVGAAYGVTVVGEDLDVAAGPVAGALLLAAELAYWAIEPGAAVRVRRAATFRRAGLVLGLAALGAACAGVLMAAAWAPLEGGAALGVAGVAALGVIAVIAVGLLYSLRDRVE